LGGHNVRVHTANTANHGDHGGKKKGFGAQSSEFGAAENATNEEVAGNG